MIYGYARCSTNESKQDINRQLRELKAEGAEEVYFEYEHGDSAVKQKQLALFDAVSEGDTIITLEVPRLARSTKQLCEIIEIVKEKKLKLIIKGVSQWIALLADLIQCLMPLFRCLGCLLSWSLA